MRIFRIPFSILLSPEKEICILILLHLIIISLPVLNDLNVPKAKENGIEVVDGGASIDQDETEQDDSGGFE